MSLSALSSANLKKLIQLVKDKEVLEAKLEKAKSAIDALGEGEKTQQVLSKKRGSRRGRRRTSLKDALLKALQASGKTGLSIKELSAKLNANHSSVSVWFYTTGKKIKGLRKIGPGKYTYSPT